MTNERMQELREAAEEKERVTDIMERLRENESQTKATKAEIDKLDVIIEQAQDLGLPDTAIMGAIVKAEECKAQLYELELKRVDMINTLDEAREDAQDKGDEQSPLFIVKAIEAIKSGRFHEGAKMVADYLVDQLDSMGFAVDGRKLDRPSCYLYLALLMRKAFKGVDMQ